MAESGSPKSDSTATKTRGVWADPTDAEKHERTRRLIAVIGNTIGSIALFAAVAAVAALLWFTNDGVSIGDVFEDDRSGTTTIAVPFLLLMLSLIGFFFGQFATRGRWGTGTNTSTWSSGTFRVVLNPVSVALHVLFLLLALFAWALVLPLPVFLQSSGALAADEGSTSAEQFWFTVVVYGVVSGGIAAVVGVSLVKKLSYNRLLENGRNGIVDGSTAQVTWRRFSHIWRGELMIAALGGAALGLSPLGIHLDSAAYGFGLAVTGVVLLAVAVGLALNAWRSGLPVERVESYT